MSSSSPFEEEPRLGRCYDRIEKCYERFADGCARDLPHLHNQIRMAYTHIIRREIGEAGMRSCVEKVLEAPGFFEEKKGCKRIDEGNGGEDSWGVGGDSRNRELSKAVDHIRRGSLDIMKAVYGVDATWIQNRLDEYRGVSKVDLPLGEGSFYDGFAGVYNHARVSYRNGKILEAMGSHDMALSEYDRAVADTRAAREAFESAKGELDERKKKGRFLLDGIKKSTRREQRRVAVNVVMMVAFLVVFLHPGLTDALITMLKALFQ